MSGEGFLLRHTCTLNFHVRRHLKMSGEGPMVCRSKCPAKLKIISRTLLVDELQQGKKNSPHIVRVALLAFLIYFPVCFIFHLEGKRVSIGM